MTPDDLAAILKWLYANDDGSGWLPAAARDLRLNERNLRGMLAGKLPIPREIGMALAAILAGKRSLKGYVDRWLSGPWDQLTPITRGLIYRTAGVLEEHVWPHTLP